jgi:hypothetical protein
VFRGVFEPDFKDRYFAYRSQVEHEDQLMGIRVGWLIGSEAFLFAGYAKVLDTTQPTSTTHRLTEALPVLGIVIAALILVAVLAAARALKDLGADSPQSRWYPRVGATGRRHLLGLAPAVALPVAVIVAWLYVWHDWLHLLGWR